MVRLAGRRLCIEGCARLRLGVGLGGLFLPGLLGVCVPVFRVFIAQLMGVSVFGVFRWVRE